MFFEMEKEQVRAGTTRRTNRDTKVKDKGRRADYSKSTTSTKTDEYDTFRPTPLRAKRRRTLPAKDCFFRGQSPPTFQWPEK